MHKKRNRFVFSIALMLALLTGALPMTFSAAMENAQAGNLQCPPMDSSLAENPAFMKSLPAHCRAQLDRATSQAVVLATGGPDDFGYTFDDTVPFNWISATNASGVFGDESATSFFDVGFSFPFYGFSYSQLSISTNGYITFDPGSACCYWGGVPIPDSAFPNNYIAPFWGDLVIGAPDNVGAIYYERGGVAPDRYLVLEWRDVTTYGGSEPFSFEVILHENGNILVQVQSLPDSYFATIGIENDFGNDGLAYQTGGSNPGLVAPKAILFTFPTTPTARLAVFPASAGKFASISADTNFRVFIWNIGTAGTDSYNLSLTSAWPTNLYQDGCVTPLADTNADTVIDTGPMPEGSSTIICVSFSPPAGSAIGDSNSGVLTFASSLDPVKTADVALSMVIPTSFVQVFEEYTNAAMAFQVNGPEGSTTNYVTDDNYFANGLATLRMPDGRYIYAWRKPDGNYPDSHSNIEFSLLNADGSFDLPVTQLTNNVGTGQTYDYSPAVAVTPNGNIGITWYRWIVDNNTGMFNYNMYFAVLDNTGILLYGPSNLTNNDLYDNFNNPDVPHFFSPAIAGTDDNRFVLSWEDARTDGIKIWYTTHDSNGANIFAPVALTNDNYNERPILNPLSGGHVILTWISFGPAPAFQVNPTYAVISGSGAIVKDSTPIDSGFSDGPISSDAVRLPNGNTAIALAQRSEVALTILDPSYNVIAGPTVAATSAAFSYYMSVTHDASNNIVMTWLDVVDPDQPSTNLYYALADSTGSFISSPTLVRNSPPGLITSENGQGNAPILPADNVMEVGIDIAPGTSANVIYQNVPLITVAILSADGFDAVRDVDRSSLTFGKTGDEASLNSCLSKQGRDVNSDGRGDLICYFRLSLTGIVLGDTQAILRGQTLNGTAFEGMDSIIVRTRPPKK